MRYIINDSDCVIQSTQDKNKCQAYMDLFGAYEGKKPFSKDGKFLNGFLGKDEFKELRKRIKDSCNDIRKKYPDIKPKKFHSELPDDDE